MRPGTLDIPDDWGYPPFEDFESECHEPKQPRLKRKLTAEQKAAIARRKEKLKTKAKKAGKKEPCWYRPGVGDVTHTHTELRTISEHTALRKL